MRNLIYVPIIHTEIDLGSMAGSFKQEYTEKYSEQTYQHHVAAIQKMWNGLTHNVLNLEIDWKNARVYQDGLPVCGREMEIITDLAKKGSKNHELVLQLIQKGATLEGTENKELLLQEYTYFQKIFHSDRLIDKKKVVDEYKKVSQKLLRQRDEYIARRIDETLQADETGLLFMGMIHQVDRYLPKNILVKFLIHRLPFEKMAKPDVPNVRLKN